MNAGVIESLITWLYAWFNSWSASHDNLCTGTLFNRIITAQWEGIVDVGSARYEPALLPPCPTISVLSCNCLRTTHSISTWIVKKLALKELRDWLLDSYICSILSWMICWILYFTHECFSEKYECLTKWMPTGKLLCTMVKYLNGYKTKLVDYFIS